MGGMMKSKPVSTPAVFPDEIIARCISWFGHLPPGSPPQQIYHFTDAVGLAGLLGEGVLRASLVTSLNDCSEVLYGLRLAKEILRRRRRKEPRVLLETALRYLNTPFVPRRALREFAPFVVSFCGRLDKSVHWLHYGQAGRGVAIGFDSASIVPPPFRLVRVEYARRVQEALIAGLMAQVQAGLAAAPAGVRDSRTAYQNAGFLFSMFMRLLAAQFKDRCFSEEEEWRLIHYRPLKHGVVSKAGRRLPRMRYRAVEGRVIPYEEIVLTPGQLRTVRSVVIGYSSALDVDDHGLGMLVRSVSPEAAISRSAVPVR
jgi:Protein of unknown function (DUF2971)